MRRLFLFLALTANLAAAPPLPSELERAQLGTIKIRMQLSPLPKPEATGDYGRSIQYHPFWEVVAPTGLNGRWSDSETDRDIGKWPIVRFFPRGTILTATPGPHTQTNWCFEHDAQDKMWLRVLSGDKDDPGGGCMVRLNKEYLRPVTVQD